MPTPLAASFLTVALLLLAYQTPYAINASMNDGDVDVVIITPYGVVFNLTAIDGALEMSRLVSGVYSITAYWMNIPVGFFAVELSGGNKAVAARLAIISPSIQLIDLESRPLNQAIIRYTGPAGIAGEIKQQAEQPSCHHYQQQSNTPYKSYGNHQRTKPRAAKP